MPSTLPTPPRSSLDKENHPSTSSATTPTPTLRKGIEWATNKEVFTFSPISGRTLNVPSTSLGPHKSILKPARPPLPFAQEKRRDITPLPDDPLENPQFLAYPVSTIVKLDSTLRDLTEAYSILTARIRSSVPQNFFSVPTRDTRHLLFNPLRTHADALADAIVRDLACVFVDPFGSPASPPVSPRKVEKTGLPTPQESPNPKKGGMSEEQVKYARDLSTVTNAAIKFLAIAFSVPAIYNVFSNKQLGAILTGVLAIPMADSLRSPTARKICGLAISVLQTQRLPDCILSIAAPRIIYALKRAIDGELGREGKKGATAEALRAVHDLSLYKPAIFVPAFHSYLTISTLLDALLAPSCALRILAAHALGGFVQAITQSDYNFDDILLDISPVVCEFILRKEPKEAKEVKDAKTNAQSIILRTLRTAMRTTDPSHHAQGPFWALSVLASFVILIGPALLKDRQVLIAFRGTIDFALKAKKRIIRATASALWGPLIWVWQKWRGMAGEDVAPTETENESEDDIWESEKVKACFEAMVHMIAHLPIGISFIGALLGSSHETCSTEDLLYAFHELSASARVGGESTQRALELLDRLVNSREDAEFFSNWSSNFLTKLVPRQLLSVSPGLLTAEISVNVLNPMIENIIGAQPDQNDVRPLADEEKCVEGVWKRAVETWVTCIEQLEMSVDDIIPDVIIDIWTGLVRMGLIDKQDSPTLLAGYASQCTDILISIFENKDIDLRERRDNEEPEPSSSTLVGDDTVVDGAASAANQRLKLTLVRAMWTATIGVFPESTIAEASKPLIRFLVLNQDQLVPSTGEESDDEDEALSEWSQFCAQVSAAAGRSNLTRTIWAHDWEWDDRTRARAWRGYARGWTEDSRGSWSEAAVILGLPFSKKGPWDMSDADLSTWSSLLAYTIDTAAEDEIAGTEVLEHVVSRIEDQHIISLSSTLRVADHLVGTLEKHIDTCTELPTGLIDLVHEVLLTSYPPEPRNKIVAIWLLRSLQTAIGNCPAALVVNLLEKLHDGICYWIADECGLFNGEEYSREIVPLFQTVLVALEPLGMGLDARVLQALSAIFAAALRVDEDGMLESERAEALTSFAEFWSRCCSEVQRPKGGWGENIKHVLKLAFPASSTVHRMDTEMSVEASPIELISIESDEEDELDVLPRTSTPRKRPVNHVPLPPSPSPLRVRYIDNAPQTVTPKKAATKSVVGRWDAPRLPALFHAAPSSPRKGSAEGRRTRKRTVSGSSTASEGAEKENAWPLANEVVYLGTKRALVEPDSSPLQAKRKRSETMGSDDSEDARAVEEVLSIIGRSPFGKADTNVYEFPQTPSKRARTATGPSVAVISTSASSSTKRHRTQGMSLGKPLAYPGAAADSDDEYLPSSSDIESEEERDVAPSSSSSPVGPFTPKAVRRAEYMLALTRDPASDDVAVSSSPTRKMRRMMRAETMESVIGIAKPPVILGSTYVNRPTRI